MKLNLHAGVIKTFYARLRSGKQSNQMLSETTLELEAKGCSLKHPKRVWEGGAKTLSHESVLMCGCVRRRCRCAQQRHKGQSSARVWIVFELLETKLMCQCCRKLILIVSVSCTDS